MASIRMIRFATLTPLATVGFFSAGNAAAQTSLISSAGPTATAGTTVNFTTEGTIDWKYYGGITTTAASYAGNEKNNLSLFSPIVPTGTGTTVGKGSGSAAQAVTIVYTDGTSPTNNGTGGTNDCYNKVPAVGNGESFTYSMAPNSAQTFKLYLESYNAIGGVRVSSGTSGTLFDDTMTPIALSVASNGTTGVAGSGNCAGSFTFAIQNLSDSVDTLTFVMAVEGTAGSSPSFAPEGITVAPEPASAALALTAALAGLSRRRRPSRSL